MKLLLLALLPSLAFGQVLRRDGGNGTFGVDVTAPSFTATAASGNNGLACQQNGCRVDFGAGASDYASSDGTTVTFAGPIGATSLTTSAASGAVAIAVTSGSSICLDGTACTKRLTAVSGLTAAESSINHLRYVTAITASTSAPPVILKGGAADGATAVAWAMTNVNTLSTAGANIITFAPDNANTVAASIDKDGMLRFGIGNTDAAPTCDATQRNKLWVVDGAAGVTDTVSICLKAAADTYSWITLTTGG